MQLRLKFDLCLAIRINNGNPARQQFGSSKACPLLTEKWHN
jgi:hypothetical protein